MSRERRSPDTQWFVEPLDYESNVQIMDFLAKTSGSSEEVEHIKIADSKAKLHNVLEVSYDAMAYMVKSRKNLPNLKFRTWNRTQPRAPLRDCSILFSRKTAGKSAEVKRVKRELAKIKSRQNHDDPEPF